jgi:hypothetical protein
MLRFADGLKERRKERDKTRCDGGMNSFYAKSPCLIVIAVLL